MIYIGCFPNADMGYAVGLYGTIVKTYDAGKVWTVLSTGIYSSSYAFLSDYFLNADTGYIGGGIIGGDGSIWKTTNGGATWTAEPGVSDSYFYSVFFTNADMGFAVGDAGTVRKSYRWRYCMGYYTKPDIK